MTASDSTAPPTGAQCAKCSRVEGWNEGVEDERAAVVVWLRATSPDLKMPQILADGIERGDHRG